VILWFSSEEAPNRRGFTPRGSPRYQTRLTLSGVIHTSGTRMAKYLQRLTKAPKRYHGMSIAAVNEPWKMMVSGYVC
jgi:hypothetical protein